MTTGAGPLSVIVCSLINCGCACIFLAASVGVLGACVRLLPWCFAAFRWAVDGCVILLCCVGVLLCGTLQFGFGVRAGGLSAGWGWVGWCLLFVRLLHASALMLVSFLWLWCCVPCCAIVQGRCCAGGVQTCSACPGLLLVLSAMQSARIEGMQNLAAHFARFASLSAVGRPRGLRTMLPAILVQVTWFSMSPMSPIVCTATPNCFLMSVRNFWSSPVCVCAPYR